MRGRAKPGQCKLGEACDGRESFFLTIGLLGRRANPTKEQKLEAQKMVCSFSFMVF